MDLRREPRANRATASVVGMTHDNRSPHDVGARDRARLPFHAVGTNRRPWKRRPRPPRGGPSGQGVANPRSVRTGNRSIALGPGRRGATRAGLGDCRPPVAMRGRISACAASNAGGSVGVPVARVPNLAVLGGRRPRAGDRHRRPMRPRAECRLRHGRRQRQLVRNRSARRRARQSGVRCSSERPLRLGSVGGSLLERASRRRDLRSNRLRHHLGDRRMAERDPHACREPFERAAHRARILEPLVRIDLERLHHDLSRGRPGSRGRARGRGTLHSWTFASMSRSVFSGRGAAGRQLLEHDAEREDVGAVVDARRRGPARATCSELALQRAGARVARRAIADFAIPKSTTFTPPS